MQILIKVASDEKPGEWAIVELQGDLESRKQSGTSEKFIGDLHFNNQNVPILIIGHHILHGKVTHLDKPLAVIEKVKSTDVTSEAPKKEKTPTSYHVKAIVHKKLLFKTRPKPIVANVYGGVN